MMILLVKSLGVCFLIGIILTNLAVAGPFRDKRGVILRGFEAGTHQGTLTETQVEDYLYRSGLDDGGVPGASNARQDWKVSWYYTYGVFPGATAEWAGQNGMEFVPMVWGRTLRRADGSSCNLSKSSSSLPRCKTWQFRNELQAAMDRMEEVGAPPVRYLTALNEPYSAQQSNVNQQDAAFIYRRFILPVADQLGLKLLSPAVGANEKGREWLAEFLRRCRRSKKCDHNQIDIFNLHYYQCRERMWTRQFSHEEDIDPSRDIDDVWYDRMVEELQRIDPKHAEMWDEFVRSRKVWITETSCNEEYRAGTLTSPQQVCERMTGTTSEEGWGSGSLGAINNLDRIERYAWWSTYLDRSDVPAMLARQMELDGTKSLVGEAFAGYRPIFKPSQQGRNDRLCRPSPQFLITIDQR